MLALPPPSPTAVVIVQRHKYGYPLIDLSIPLNLQVHLLEGRAKPVKDGCWMYLRCVREALGVGQQRLVRRLSSDTMEAAEAGMVEKILDREEETVPRAPSKKPCRFFAKGDCYRGDSCHMVHTVKHKLAPCQVHQFWMEDPWARPPCPWGANCARPHANYTGPGDPDLLRTNIALQTENSQFIRVRAYASEVVGAGGRASDTGVARSGTSRYNQKLALLSAKDPADFSRRCVEDMSLCRSLLRVYILGGGVCTSLEEVGKQVSTQVASGSHHPGQVSPAPASDSVTAVNGRSEEPATTAGGVPGPPPSPRSALVKAPLRVRVQALPKAMERQLIDDKSPFWGDNFLGMVRERQAGVFTHVLSVIFVRGAFLFGLAEASTHGRSIIDNNTEEAPVCRAFYKIKEVTTRAGLSYNDGWTAIDVGSAPGGWTSYLAARCRRVISVDPAELDPAVIALPNVAHVQQMICAAHGTIQRLLTAQAWRKHAPTAQGHASAPSSTHFTGNSTECSAENSAKDSMQIDAEPLAANTAPGSTKDCGVTNFKPDFAADLLVSDMNAEPEVVVDVLLSVLGAGLVKPGALIVATFKDFCGRQKRMRDEVQAALTRLKLGGTAAAATFQEGRRCDEDVVARAENEHGGRDGTAAGFGGAAANLATTAGVSCRWRLENIETLKLLSGGQAEVTIVGRAAGGTQVGVAPAAVGGE